MRFSVIVCCCVIVLYRIICEFINMLYTSSYLCIRNRLQKTVSINFKIQKTMDAEMKSPMTEKIVEKKVYEEDGKKHEYASKGVAGTALGLGIAGTALALMPALGGSRGLFGGLGSGYG